MIKKEMIAMLLAGGQGSRLGVLTAKMAKPAVAFGGKYRIIDFPLSNCINSGVDTVGVLTQYQPLRLNTHIGIGIVHAFRMPLDTQGKCVGIRLQRFDHTVIGKGRWDQMRCRGLDNLMVIRISEGIRAKEPVEYTVFRKCYFVGRVTSMECLLKMIDARLLGK